jgi:preprotein translocase subunit SecB
VENGVAILWKNCLQLSPKSTCKKQYIINYVKGAGKYMIKIGRDCLHNIQLEFLRILSLNCYVEDNFDVGNSDDIKIEISIENYGEVISNTKGNTYLKTKVEGKWGEKAVFNIELTYEGICKAENEVDQKEFKFYLEMQSVPMLWGYTRETINNIMFKMGLKPILLPVLNITEIMEKLRQVKDGTGGEE